MSHVVFVLGAGASKQAGAPLMMDFLDIANDLLWNNKVGDYRESFERVFSAVGALQAVHSKAQLDLNNIETIFTALELGRVIQRFPGMDRSDIPQAIADLKRLIVKTLELTIKYPVKERELDAPKPYGAFASLIDHIQKRSSPKKTASIITFNYDLAIDVALYLADIGVDYALGATPSGGRVNMDLMKLHGSLNWATEVASDKILPIAMGEYFGPSRRRFDSTVRDVPLQIGTKIEDYFKSIRGLDVKPEPVIVPPSWNKADYHHALSDVWAAAAKNLSEAEYIFVIGYSLPETDSFFRHLFALGSVGTYALRKFVVFNPDEAIDERFRSLLGPGSLARYSFKQKTFEQAISEIGALFPAK